MNEPVAIRCWDVRKAFAGVPVLQGFDLNVRQGRVMALLGPSGCGKTTVLRLIAGLEQADGGAIEVGGVLVAAPDRFVPPERRRVGLVFQDYALFPHLTVAENVGYGRPRHDPRRAARITEMLDLVGLGALADRMAYELSGGEQQRVALARALAPEPLVVLLDEPFSNLDADLRRQIRQEMRDILRRAGTTVVFVTHDQEEALFMGDEVAVMHDGRIDQADTPERIFHYPRTRFVAAFLGGASFLPARVEQRGLQSEIGTLLYRAPLPEGAAVEVMVRADDVDIVPGPAGAAIVDRQFQGTQNLYRVRLPSGRVVHSLQDHTVHYDPGTPVTVLVPPVHPLTCFRNGESVIAEPLAGVTVAPRMGHDASDAGR